MPARRSSVLAVAAASAAALLALTGCSASGSATPVASSGPVTVDFWHAMTGPAATELDKLVSQYNGSNEQGVTVKATFQGQYADVQTKYTAAVQSGSTPDLLMMNDVSTGFMVDSGQTVAPSTFAKETTTGGSIVPAAKAYYSAGDGLAAMPFSVSMPVLYLDKAIVQRAGLDVTKPPTTLDQVAQWADQIHRTTGLYGMSMNMADSWMLEELSASGGQPFCTPSNGRTGKAVTGVSLTSDTQVAFMTTLQGLYQDGAALNPGTDSAAQNSAFSSGKVGMVLTSSGAYTTLDPTGTKSVVSTFPTTSGAKDAGAVIGGNALWISGKGHSSAEQRASYDFAAWLETPEVQAEWAKATGYLAVNTASKDTAVGKQSLADPNVATMYRQLSDDPTSTASAGCVTGAFPTVRATVIGAFNKVVEGADVRSTMRAAETQAKSQIASYNAAAGK
ncbi:extracellular solute-binding protein [Curtobacterium sp. Csp2]|uniref:extracellular solute-binding protein n=1 Tax=Curtobacterium sp. Csp2 TaxID=2495430 RepID=UPI00158097CE|nr:extracellular solute-binding protein [Curtobacterium sp. Csp2]QKS15451.1 extracellular solute-binding protein [Curtobacterium sp. Csp2]QKS15480.1 extracellular solute-binding protein [Curtobacterium sp. Csp2]